ncbi:MAG: class I SAM-dependent methyltransferase [Legionella sp.]|jgi:SAM-dependent methyltransferase
MSETFKPIAVQDPTAKPWLFKLRCLIDLQLDTIVKYLRPELAKLQGKVLDVGAGQSPWRGWLAKDTEYQGIDIKNSSEFGMSVTDQGLIYYDGAIMPLQDNSYDHVLCIEVLEHALDPELLLSEIARVLRQGGTLLLTVPWSARRHHIPYDFHRFTFERLTILFVNAGFTNIEIKERGNDIHVIANKLLVLNLRLLKPTISLSNLWKLTLGLFCLPITAIFLIFAHISKFSKLGSNEDPLGYFVKGVKLKGLENA